MQYSIQLAKIVFLTCINIDLLAADSGCKSGFTKQLWNENMRGKLYGSRSDIIVKTLVVERRQPTSKTGQLDLSTFVYRSIDGPDAEHNLAFRSEIKIKIDTAAAGNSANTLATPSFALKVID